MRFHVQIGRGFRVARAFNLTERELHERILAPWRADEPILLGDREWEPARSELRILAGPELAPQDLAMGQGWQSAERSARDATAELLAAPAPLPAAVAVLAQTREAGEAARAALTHLGVRSSEWEPGRTRAVLVAFDASPGDGTDDARWWLNVGIALGALGERAVLAVRGADVLPAPLAHALALRLDGDVDAAAQALSERLRM